MDTQHDKNVGKIGTSLRLVRGGRYGAPVCSAELTLERTVRERFAALRGRNGKALRDRTVYNIAEDVTHPARIYARIIRRLKAKHVPYEDAREAVVAPLADHLRRMYGRTNTGEFRPAA